MDAPTHTLPINHQHRAHSIRRQGEFAVPSKSEKSIRQCLAPLHCDLGRNDVAVALAPVSVIRLMIESRQPLRRAPLAGKKRVWPIFLLLAEHVCLRAHAICQRPMLRQSKTVPLLALPTTSKKRIEKRRVISTANPMRSL